jgi:hypothetical protein
VWQSLYDSLEIVLRRGSERVPPPDDASLDQFERVHGAPLPASYREFVKVFGAGELGGFFRIRAPGYPAGSDASLDGFNRRMHAGDDAQTERFRRLVYVAGVNGGETVAWDTGDVRSASPHEFGICLRTRDDKLLELAGSFAEFVMRICLTTGLDEAWRRAGVEVEDEWPVQRVFVPEQRPRRRG